MPITIDELDEEILKYLENDARKSLKKLAEDLQKKTSTIYHRLQRMQNNKVILGYNVVFNPEFFNYKKIGQIKIYLKPHNIKGFDSMFIGSFANFLKEEYKQILFISIIEKENQIFCIIPFKTQEKFAEFMIELRKNPYVDDIKTEFFSEIIKGHKIFNFDKNLINRNLISKENKKETTNGNNFKNLNGMVDLSEKSKK